MYVNQHLWWPLAVHLLIEVICAMRLMIAILNTCTRFANSLSANTDVCNVLVY